MRNTQVHIEIWLLIAYFGFEHNLRHYWELMRNVWVPIELSDFWLQTLVSWQMWAQFETLMKSYLQLLRRKAKINVDNSSDHLTLGESIEKCLSSYWDPRLLYIWFLGKPEHSLRHYYMNVDYNSITSGLQGEFGEKCFEFIFCTLVHGKIWA